MSMLMTESTVPAPGVIPGSGPAFLVAGRESTPHADLRELTPSEIDAVSGGLGFTATVGAGLTVMYIWHNFGDEISEAVNGAICAVGGAVESLGEAIQG